MYLGILISPVSTNASVSERRLDLLVVQESDSDRYPVLGLKTAIKTCFTFLRSELTCIPASMQTCIISVDVYRKMLLFLFHTVQVGCVTRLDVQFIKPQTLMSPVHLNAHLRHLTEYLIGETSAY